MENLENILKQIPQVEKILQSEKINEFIPLLGKGIIVNIIREEIKLFREQFDKDQEIDIERLMSSIVESCVRKKREKLQRVINGTGVVIHTNLGRSPISEELLRGLTAKLSGYCNLELDLPLGKRGKRGGFAEELICNLTSAEDALIVNNNSASVFLILSEFAKGKGVVISRSELVQIGGGFRIPDILMQTGARLLEVGTTNITDIDDYRKAITEDTAMILSVHKSNFRIEGFSSSPSLKELAGLKNPSRLFVRDLGSGNLLVDARFPKTFEPTISFELSQGPDILCFSGDKMLGGCQAGIIVGRKDLIQKLKKNPLMRMFRVDKITYYILQETLIQYANRNIEKISLWSIIFQNKRTLGNKANRLIKKVKAENKKEYITRVPAKSVFGGGSLPTLKVESIAMQINIPGVSAKEIYNKFLNREIPIAGYILDDKFMLDLRAIADNEIPEVAEAIDGLMEEAHGR
ncbi:MAG: L-seryl-tRNA(Sec) selenium transferase [Spirochaetes bacterium]|nr:L-seryl-tRNA(Sec) selenium transferase [Spirochaetota bacterium]